MLTDSILRKQRAIPTCFLMTQMRQLQYALLIIALLACVSAIGCGSSGPFDYIPISGKVTYEDGSPVTTGRLQFESQAPTEGTIHPRPAVALIKRDGTFDAVTSHKFGDGLIPGKHKVAFIFATDASGKSLVPKEYTSMTTTPLEIDTADSPLHIKIRKP